MKHFILFFLFIIALNNHSISQKKVKLKQSKEHFFLKKIKLSELIFERDGIIGNLKIMSSAFNKLIFTRKFLQNMKEDKSIIDALRNSILVSMDKFNIKTNSKDLIKCIQKLINIKLKKISE